MVHAVVDLDKAAAAYKDLGFTTTPRADHPFGTSNRLVVLNGSYIELVAVTDPSLLPVDGFARDVQRFLDGKGPGIPYVVLRSGEPDNDLTDLGNLITETFSFSRPAPLLNGEEMTASFTCLLTAGAGDLGVFFCHHHEPKAVWNKAAMLHDNGAGRLKAMTLPSAGTDLTKLATLAGSTAAKSGTQIGGVTITAGSPSSSIGPSLSIVAASPWPMRVIDGVNIQATQSSHAK